MNLRKRGNKYLLYFQALAFALLLVFSPCSVRNSIEESLGLTKTEVINKSKATNNLKELCSIATFDHVGDNPLEITDTTPDIPSFEVAQINCSKTNLGARQDIFLGQYQSPSTIKDKTPLYLLHQQFKVHLQGA